MLFKKILKNLITTQNKIWVDKGNKFCNRSMKSQLEKNDIDMYSTYNEEKSVIAESFIRTLKNKTYKYMTSVSKIVYINKLQQYSSTYHIISYIVVHNVEQLE